MKELAGSKRTLAIGLGNPLSGDDSFGTKVLERLRQHGLELLPHVSVADGHTDLLSQIEKFSEYDRVVIVDAILDPNGAQGQPGRIAVVDEETFRSWPETSPSIHQMSPLLAVKLFRGLYPASQTRITLVGFLVDQIRHESSCLTDSLIKEGADAVRALS